MATVNDWPSTMTLQRAGPGIGHIYVVSFTIYEYVK